MSCRDTNIRRGDAFNFFACNGALQVCRQRGLHGLLKRKLACVVELSSVGHDNVGKTCLDSSAKE